MTFRLQRKLPYKRMLIVTGVLLAFVLVVMVGPTVRTMQGAGWLPIHALDIELAVLAGHLARRLPDLGDARRAGRRARAVIGSYFAAEYVRVKRPRRRQPRGPTRADSGRPSCRPTHLRRRRMEGAASPWRGDSHR